MSTTKDQSRRMERARAVVEAIDLIILARQPENRHMVWGKQDLYAAKEEAARKLAEFVQQG
jgi:hypothetical protein